MTTPPAAATPPPRLVGSFIIGLNILRRQIGSYPPGHPAVGNAAEKVIRLLRHLLRDTESLTLTFSRDTVMWGLIPLERSNPVFRDYARALSSRGVAALSFSTATSPDDLLRLNRVLALRKEEIYAAGGVNALLQQEGSVHLDLQEIDYRQFRLIEGEREKNRNPETSMWENLVLSMFAEGDAGTTSELAANLNTYLEQNPARREDTYASVIAAFVRSMESGASDGGAGNFAAKLAALATKLAPEIRDQFVATAFELLPEKSAEAEALFLAIPQEVIVAAIEEINLQKGGVPPVLLGLLGKLGAGVANDAGAASESQHDAVEMADKVRVLLRPEKFHHFVPDVYQGKLELLLAGDSVSGVLREEAAELRNAFYGENSAVKTGDIVAEIVKTFPADNIMLSEPLEDLCLYLLESGDLTSLLHICRKIRETEQELDTRLFGPALPDALVHAVDSWGKERQAELKEVMRIVGEPVVEPLLERLSTENNMALRRHFIECVASIGPAARTTVLNRLGDNRWYVLRNLIIILRRFNDRADIVHIRPLLRHSHDKVRMEALRTLLDLRDREAEKSLASEIQRGTKEVQLASIQMAEGSRSPEVIEALMRVVEKSGMNTDYEVRKLGVRILATTADVRALPVLDKLLHTRSILRSSNAEALKMEIVRSLPSYPARPAAQLLGKIASAGLGEVSRTATSLLSVIREQTR